MSDWLKDKAVVLVGDGAALDAIEKRFAEHGATIHRAAVAADLDGAKAALSEIESSGFAPSVLVHATSSLSVSEPESPVEPTQFRAAVSENLDSKFFYSSAIAQMVIGKRSAAILFIEPFTQDATIAASATTGAMSSLTKTLGVEWARDGIRVNAIASDVATGDVDERMDSFSTLAAYLCSDYAAYVTGATVGIDDLV